MSWSLKLGRVAGIPIQVHWTFLILLAYIGFDSWSQGHSLSAALQGIGFVIALFGCVVLHELGHALTARQFGIATADITLLPIGGVARLQRMPEQPSQELVVALAGPAVNLVLAAILVLSGIRLPLPGPEDVPSLLGGQFWPDLLRVNLALAIFNLLPAFPMDGGRVLRALLAMRMDYARATRSAASVGQFLAIAFGLLGLMGGNALLVLVALFVWIGAEAEAQQVEVRATLGGVKVGAAMLTDYRRLAPEDSLGLAAELLLAGSQQDFPVLDQDRPVGVLTRQDLLRGLAEGGRDAPVAHYVSTDLASVDVDDPLVPVLERLREGQRSCLQVLAHGQPVGLLTAENIGEYMLLRAALQGGDPHGAAQRTTA